MRKHNFMRKFLFFEQMFNFINALEYYPAKLDKNYKSGPDSMKFQHLYLTSFVHLKCYRYCHIIDPSIARLLDFSIFHDQQCHYQNSTPGNFNNKGRLNCYKPNRFH